MRAWFALPLALLAGCSGLKSSAPVEQVYVLRPAPSQTAPVPLPASLQILRVESHPGLGSDRIILLRPGRRLDAYSGARFASSLPDVLGALVVESFRSSGAFANVSEDRNVGSDFALDISVLRFEAQYTDDLVPPTVQVVLDCTLLDRRRRDVLASFRISAAVTATENRLGAVVAAMETAANRALEDMRLKTVDAVLKAPPPAGEEPAGPRRSAP